MATPSSEPVLERSFSERERIAETLADRLDKPLTAAGFLFALLVLAETTIELSGGVHAVFDVTAWVLWLLFVVEFVARLVVAPSTRKFLRKNWWQLFFLAVPFLRFLRPLARLRIPRVGRIVSSAVRTSRAAARRLSGRLAWLATLTLIVVVACSQFAYVVGGYDTYPQALYDIALAATTGEPTGRPVAAMQVLDVVLAVFSVVVFAALAGSLGAYFLERHGEAVTAKPATSVGRGSGDDPLGGPGQGPPSVSRGELHQADQSDGAAASDSHAQPGGPAHAEADGRPDAQQHAQDGDADSGQ